MMVIERASATGASRWGMVPGACLPVRYSFFVQSIRTVIVVSFSLRSDV